MNQVVENVFLSSSYDGAIKLWDLRNESKPIATLQKLDKGQSKEDYKVFALEWNGASQILSGGSDNCINVHDMNQTK